MHNDCKQDVLAEQYRVVNNLRLFREVIVAWGLIILSVILPVYFDQWYMVILSILIISSAHQRLFTIYHEAFHNNLAENRKLGDIVGSWMAAYPSFSRYHGVKKRHIKHHKFTANNKDPERVSHAKSIIELIPFTWYIFFMAVKKITGVMIFEEKYNSFMNGRGSWNVEDNDAENIKIIITNLILLVIFSILINIFDGDLIYVFIYHATLFFVSPLFMVLRQWVEHYVEDDSVEDPRYIIINANFIERMLFSPMNFHYHAIHHYYPWVTYNMLPKLYKEMKDKELLYIERSSYFSVIKKLIL